ncbi:MAG: ankyrin repeat domain-containing protein [Candidatus Aminicenantes bacterium]|nr:ankyrin repeat domain-containing protein [Candidatus Aminicenantes bacterium]
MRRKKMKKFAMSILISGIVFCCHHFSLASDEIHEASANGNLKQVMEILKKDPHLLNQPDQNGRTPLHHACITGKNQMAGYLIEQGAELDPKDENKNTPLHIAALRGNLELVKMLLKKGSKSIHEGASWNNNPLHLACERGHPKVVSFLIEHGANIEARNEMKRTPLIAAAREKGDLNAIKILVDKGADIHARDISNDTALTLAAWRGFEDVVDYLVEKESVIPENRMKSALLFSAEKNLYHLYQYLLENGMEIKKIEDEMQTLIHSAAAGGSTEILRSLIKQGFDPDLRDKDGWAPLHYAASQGKLEMIEHLIQIGVDKNCRNKKGETAYHLTSSREFPEAAQKLKDLGVDSSAPRFPDLKGLYMGQKPPGNTPEMFLPGIVSGHYDAHSTIVFSPEGKEACWTEMYPPRGKGYGTSGVMMMKMENGRWTYPEKSTVMDGEPFFSPNGKKLYFLSTKPLPGEKRGGKENIWHMTKTSSGWSEPTPLDNVVNSMELHWHFSLDKKGNLYFANWNQIFFAENDKGTFKKPVDISELYNNPTLKGFCPFISPDGSYLLFSAPKQEGGRNIDLYISFKQKDGTWTDRIHLGDDINASMHDISAYVSPDEKYLFFTSVGENRPWGIYWVDAKVIEKLKPDKQK